MLRNFNAWIGKLEDVPMIEKCVAETSGIAFSDDKIFNGKHILELPDISTD